MTILAHFLSSIQFRFPGAFFTAADLIQAIILMTRWAWPACAVEVIGAHVTPPCPINVITHPAFFVIGAILACPVYAAGSSEYNGAETLKAVIVGDTRIAQVSIAVFQNLAVAAMAAR